MFKNKKFLPFVLALIIVISVFVYISRYSQRGKATQPNIDISITPSSGNFSVGEEKTVDFLLQPAGTGYKISGIDLYFNTQGSAEISGVSSPVSFPGNDTSLFTEVIKDIKPQRAHISYIAIKSEDQLPTTVKVQVKFKGIRTGSGSVSIDNTNTQIVGNIVGNTYNLGSLGQGSFTFLGIGDTLTPTPTPINGNPKTTSTVSDNFDGGSLDGNIWSSWLSPENATGSVKVENGVLRSNLSAIQNFYRAAVAEIKNKITQDFEASADIKIEQGGDPYGSDTGLYFHDDPWDNQITMFLRKETGSIVNLYATSIVNKQTTIVVKQAVSSNNATVKIQRIGQTANYYYKDSNGQFVLLGSQNNVYPGDGRLALHVNSWEQNYPTVLSSFDNFSAKLNLLSVSGPTLTPIPTSTPCLTLSQSDNFIGNLNSNFWSIRSSPKGEVTQQNGMLKASLPGGETSEAGLITNGKVCGDFDVRVDLNQFTSSGQPEGNARLTITDQIMDDKNVEVTIQRYSKGNEQGFWTDMKKPDGTFFGGSNAISAATSGILRIRRQGSAFTTYYDDGNGWKKLGYYPSGFTSNANIIIGVGAWSQNPSVSANFDNFNLTTAIADPSGTPVPSSTPVPTASPSPTPPSGREKYIIEVGDKSQKLVIIIGPSINPQIKFKAKLASLRAYPELYLKLRVKDELAFLDNQNNLAVSADTCNNPTLPDRDFLIPMKATGDVYSPVQQISQPAPAGSQVAYVDGNGWIILDGMVPGRYYTLYLKGPKTRKSKVVEHFLLQPNQVSTQDFDWTGKLLDPGDLPDPANGNKQDCTINSADWSLEKTRIGANDGDNLAVCDVNYDGICNAGDSVAILDTLSKRPDDDQ